MNLGKMEKFSLFYSILNYLFAKIFHHIFWYKELVIVGKENLKKYKSYIITPNHQNALMDALIVGTTSPFQMVWLARADIFSGPFVQRLLRAMKIMPVYRMRDGAQSLGKNEAIFNRSIEILEHNTPLGLFPETTHWGFRRLRATKKAVPRIAFMAEEKNDFKLGIEIVPCGIYYEKYQPARSRAIVQYGKPFPIAEYIDAYKENQNKGYQALRKRIEDEIRPLIIDIRTEKYYDLFETLRHVYDERAMETNTIEEHGLMKKFRADKITIDILTKTLQNDENRIENLQEKTNTYTTRLKKLGINESLIKETGTDSFSIIWGIMRTIVFFPLFLYGATFHIIPYKIPLWVTKKVVKDPQFVSSFNFALGFFLFPLFHLIALLLFNALTDFPLWASFVFLISLLTTGIFTLDYYNNLKLLLSKLRYLSIKTNRKQEVIECKNLRQEIISDIDALV